MPIYDFKCEKCEKVFERIVISYEAGEKEPPTCECGGTSKMQPVSHRRFGPNSNDSSVRVHFNYIPDIS
jgi:putative FmdB family regulatory protein